MESGSGGLSWEAPPITVHVCCPGYHTPTQTRGKPRWPEVSCLADVALTFTHSLVLLAQLLPASLAAPLSLLPCQTLLPVSVCVPTETMNS